ncbi:MAG: PHP domain-containing protein [Verrucomicrobiota bacterium]|nr:PHP domain-containing protein [Verrucomicrobiota bacterium]
MLEADWIKCDLHIHTLDDPKDALDYTAHQLLDRARSLGFGVLAITLHDAVFDDPGVFADAARMGILLIRAAELRVRGADIVILNVGRDDISGISDFDHIRALRARKGTSIFTFAPHPFYLFGGSIGARLIENIDCFDGIEFCHFYRPFLNPNRRAVKVAARFGKPLIATSDAHRLHGFGRHYTSFPAPSELSVETVLAALRGGELRLTSPAASVREIAGALYFLFLEHPWRRRRRDTGRLPRREIDPRLESDRET